MLKSILDFLTAKVPISLWVLIVIILCMVINLAVLMDIVNKRKGIGE